MNIFEAMKGYVMYHCLYVGVSSGVFGFVNNNKNSGVSAEQLSKELKLHEDYLQVWLDASIAFGIMESREGKYFVRKESAPFLLDNADVKYQGNLIRLFVEHLSEDMKKQPEYLKTGEVFQFSDHNKEFVELISARGYLRAKSFINNFLKKFPRVEELFLQEKTICDIGCGSGSFIQGLNESYKAPKYIGVDRDEKSIELANSAACDNMSFVLSDMSDVSFSEDLDCITMVLTLHEISGESRADVLKKCFQALAPGGFLLIMEFPYPESQKEFFDKKFLMGILDQYFEMIWGTKHIGWLEQKRLLTEAGFENIQRLFFENDAYMAIIADKSN